MHRSIVIIGLAIVGLCSIWVSSHHYFYELTRRGMVKEGVPDSALRFADRKVRICQPRCQDIR